MRPLVAVLARSCDRLVDDEVVGTCENSTESVWSRGTERKKGEGRKERAGRGPERTGPHEIRVSLSSCLTGWRRDMVNKTDPDR